MKRVLKGNRPLRTQSRKACISEAEQETSIPRPVLKKMGIEIGDPLMWDVMETANGDRFIVIEKAEKWKE